VARRSDDVVLARERERRRSDRGNAIEAVEIDIGFPLLGNGLNLLGCRRGERRCPREELGELVRREKLSRVNDAESRERGREVAGLPWVLERGHQRGHDAVGAAPRSVQHERRDLLRVRERELLGNDAAQ
jgi:hypothetical protein